MCGSDRGNASLRRATSEMPNALSKRRVDGREAVFAGVPVSARGLALQDIILRYLQKYFMAVESLG